MNSPEIVVDDEDLNSSHISEDGDRSFASQNDEDTEETGRQGPDDIFSQPKAFDSQDENPINTTDKAPSADNADGLTLDETKEKTKKELEEEERERMQVLVSHFTEEQLDRYEMYRRSAFPKAAIKRIMQTNSGTSVHQNAVIAMSGIAKVLVGEVVETALDSMEELGESGPLQPKHLREAVRRLRIQGRLGIGKSRKRPLS